MSTPILQKLFSPAVTSVLDERQRQLDLGWDEANDDKNVNHEMATAASAYILAAEMLANPIAAQILLDNEARFLEDCWPKTWDRKWFKVGKTHREKLVAAAALLVAEIERLDRAESQRT